MVGNKVITRSLVGAVDGRAVSFIKGERVGVFELVEFIIGERVGEIEGTFVVLLDEVGNTVIFIDRSVGFDVGAKVWLIGVDSFRFL